MPLPKTQRPKTICFYPTGHVNLILERMPHGQKSKLVNAAIESFLLRYPKTYKQKVVNN